MSALDEANGQFLSYLERRGPHYLIDLILRIQRELGVSETDFLTPADLEGKSQEDLAAVVFILTERAGSLEASKQNILKEILKFKTATGAVLNPVGQRAPDKTEEQIQIRKFVEGLCNVLSLAENKRAPVYAMLDSWHETLGALLTKKGADAVSAANTLVEVMDSLSYSLVRSSQDCENLFGYLVQINEYIRAQLQMELIFPDQSDEFDVRLHCAAYTAPKRKWEPVQCIRKVVKPGILYKGRPIVTALVVISV